MKSKPFSRPYLNPSDAFYGSSESSATQWLQQTITPSYPVTCIYQSSILSGFKYFLQFYQSYQSSLSYQRSLSYQSSLPYSYQSSPVIPQSAPSVPEQPTPQLPEPAPELPEQPTIPQLSELSQQPTPQVPEKPVTPEQPALQLPKPTLQLPEQPLLQLSQQPITSVLPQQLPQPDFTFTLTHLTQQSVTTPHYWFWPIMGVG
ncbi:hypothetical protein HO173_010537 [Letharia columbiana]|uniref:Uncharacterized protein n=1 Tax=Letharia columbiana TaxID=112416 RepID=A0A8H6FMD2_9LECA|nr:uncharacterized protein HO173_010537 [Letharia columbiana]KAF6231205.1 hypothetical protein HO173_010537 [Letharia columbiana]